MRRLIALTPAVFALALSACAAGSGSNAYLAERQRLADECTARGGFPVPTGSQSGRPQLETVCEIRGGTARAPSPAN